MDGGGDMTADVVHVDPPRSIVVACVMWRRHHSHFRAGVRIIRVFVTRLHVHGSSDIGFWIAPDNAAACVVVTRVSQLVSEHTRVHICIIDDDEYICACDTQRARQPRLNKLARSADAYVLRAHYLHRLLALAGLPISFEPMCIAWMCSLEAYVHRNVMSARRSVSNAHVTAASSAPT